MPRCFDGLLDWRLGIVPLLGAAWAGGCGGEGHLRIRVETPMPALSPVDDRLDDLTLTVGERVFRAAYDGDTTSIPLDGIAVTDEAWITLEGRGDNQRLVGYGRLTDPVRIGATDD